MARIATWQQAENYVAHRYNAQGWQILGRNIRVSPFEIDLIAIKAKTMVAVEVKFRSHQPQLHVPREKLKNLRKALTIFAAQTNLKVHTLRIDWIVLNPNGDYMFVAGLE